MLPLLPFLLLAALLFTAAVMPYVLRGAPPRTLGRKMAIGTRIYGAFVLVPLIAIKLIVLAH